MFPLFCLEGVWEEAGACRTDLIISENARFGKAIPTPCTDAGIVITS